MTDARLHKRPSWDDVWMRLAEDIGQRSRCSRGEIGCVLVSRDNQVVSATYVGPPPRFKPADTIMPTDCRAWCPRAQPGHEPEIGYTDCVSSHAEMNAIARADFSRLKGGTAYVNGACCIMCSKALAAAGISRVVMQVHEADAHRKPEQAIALLEQNGVQVVIRSSQ